MFTRSIFSVRAVLGTPIAVAYLRAGYPRQTEFLNNVDVYFSDSVELVARLQGVGQHFSERLVVATAGIYDRLRGRRKELSVNITDILLDIVVFERHFPAAGDQRIFADRPVRMVGVGYRVAPLVAVLVSQIPGVLFAQVVHCVPIPRTTPQER